LSDGHVQNLKNGFLYAGPFFDSGDAMAERRRCAAPWLGKRGKEGLTGEVRARRRRAPVGVDAGSRGRWLRRGNRATRRSQVATAQGDAAARPAADDGGEVAGTWLDG
jgi:hypothetical protein